MIALKLFSIHASMSDRNARLVKENTILKASLTDNLNEQEDMLKRSIKADYFSNIAYKEAVETVDESIRCMEECLSSCRKVRSLLEQNHGRIKNASKEENNVLREKTNTQYFILR